MAEGYGVEVWCTDRYQSGRFVRGPLLLAQAMYRRYTTERGSLQGVSDEDDELNYGFDVAGYVGEVGPQLAAAALPGIMRAEGLKDNRVLDIVVEPTLTELGAEGFGLDLAVDVQGKDPKDNFQMTLRIEDVTLDLLQVRT